MKYAVIAIVLVIQMLAPAEGWPLSLGTLPAADSLVLHVALDEGLFAEEGLDVELYPFQSAIEMGAAVRAGVLDGYFGDVINVLLLHAAGTPQAIAAVTSRSTIAEGSENGIAEAGAGSCRRHFGIAVRPGSDVASLEAIKGRQVAVGRATIIDYVLDRMLARHGLGTGHVEHLDIKHIPVRMQMLMAGKLDAALLPEPLLSLVESRGARVIADDRGLGMTLAVIALNQRAASPQTVSALQRSLAKAMTRINDDPEAYRAVMVEKHLLPVAAASAYIMVRYDLRSMPETMPTQTELEEIAVWMRRNGLVRDAFLPQGLTLGTGHADD